MAIEDYTDEQLNTIIAQHTGELMPFATHPMAALYLVNLLRKECFKLFLIFSDHTDEIYAEMDFRHGHDEISPSLYAYDNLLSRAVARLAVMYYEGAQYGRNQPDSRQTTQ